MTQKYKLVKNRITNEIDSVRLTKTGSNILLCIPFVEENTDYQEYLEWVADGGIVEDADE